jgi:hypothetical protein
MSPSTFTSFADWIAWWFAPEHIVIAVIGAAIGLSALVALAFIIDRLWRRTNDRLDSASEPATALRIDWWLCPVCGSLNRPSQHCYKGCATTDGQVLAARGDERRSEPTTLSGSDRTPRDIPKR